MNLLLVPERPYYLCVLPCYYTSFAMLDNHYSSHREREVSMPACMHTYTQEVPPYTQHGDHRPLVELSMEGPFKAGTQAKPESGDSSNR